VELIKKKTLNGRRGEKKTEKRRMSTRKRADYQGEDDRDLSKKHSGGEGGTSYRTKNCKVKVNAPESIMASVPSMRPKVINASGPPRKPKLRTCPGGENIAGGCNLGEVSLCPVSRVSEKTSPG